MPTLSSRYGLFIALVLFTIGEGRAQLIPLSQDSAVVVVPAKGRKGVVSKWSFLHLFNRQPKDEKMVRSRDGVKKVAYDNFQGKIIRRIHLQSLDPFDYSLAGENDSSLSRGLRRSNAIHIQSRLDVIRNYVLIRENQAYDSLRLKETERLLRAQDFTREVAVLVSTLPGNSDSLDIYIYVLDRWSIAGKVALSRSEVGLRLVQKNVLGYGHAADLEMQRYHNDGDFNAYSSYFVPNIQGSYVNAHLFYGADKYKRFSKGIQIDRPFFSPLAQWGGGAHFEQLSRDDARYATDSLFELDTYKINRQNYWMGKSFRLFPEGHAESQITRLITSASFSSMRYLENSSHTFDSLQIYRNSRSYLGSIAINRRKYIRDSFIFDSGITEDVPVGALFALVGGYQTFEQGGRMYFGTRLAMAHFFRIGYLSANLNYGSYFNNSKPEQGALGLQLVYFTRLIALGDWKFRQFVKSTTTFGLNRYNYEQLTLNDFYPPGNRYNFNLLGTKKSLLSIQSQFYAPYKIWGFRFSPYLIYTLGKIGGEQTRLLKIRTYSQFGLGVLINNFNLVFNTIQLSIAYYPALPDNSRHVLGLNPFNTADFGFDNFQWGNPATVSFK